MRKQVVDSKGLPVRQIIIGVIAALLTAVVGAGLIAYLVGKGTWDEGNMKMAMVLVNLVASIIGCLTAVLSSKRSVLVTSGVVAAGYFLILLCTNLLFIDGGMDGILWTALMVAAGGIASVLIGLRGFQTKKQKKLHIRK